MTASDYRSLLEEAIDSEWGLRMSVGDSLRARAIRRRLYLARERARRLGDRSFDGLSFLLRQSGEVWIVRPVDPLKWGAIALISGRIDAWPNGGPAMSVWSSSFIT